MSQKTLVFSIALNGYQWLYRDFIQSHRRYAAKHNYDYQVVTQPVFTRVGVECCWLKLSLMLAALKGGYKTVLFVDADAYIQSGAPAIESNFVSGKALYLARSYSGRFNSGVILATNQPCVQRWLSALLSKRDQPVPESSSVGWGENGHVIEYTKQCDFVSELDKRWNNTFDPYLPDYIRHFSFGPLRRSTTLNLIHKLYSRITRVVIRAFSGVERDRGNTKMSDNLNQLTKDVLTIYPTFKKAQDGSN